MYALVSLIIIVSRSLLVVRVGTVALTMTGVSKEVVSFQALSAFSGAGFTMGVAEKIIAYPGRRMVVKTLIRLGSVGLVTSIATLILSFADITARLHRLLILLVIARFSSDSCEPAVSPPAHAGHQVRTQPHRGVQTS